MTDSAPSTAAVPDLPAALRRAAARWPDRIAWTFDPGGEMSFAAVEQRSAELAGGFAAAGIGAGDRVAIMAGNRPELPLTWLALARLGAAMVALNPRYGAADLAHVLAVARCRALVAPPEHLAQLRALPSDVPGRERCLDVTALPTGAAPPERPVGLTEPVNVQFTSGTTGRPKGCLLTHRYWLTLAGSLIEEFPRLTETDVLLTAQPFHYVDPLWNVVAGLLAGARLVALDGFHPSTYWSRVRKHGATYLYCLGAMPTLLLASPPTPDERRHRVRVVQCSGIPPARHRELEQRFAVPWYEAFGMTETGADLRVTDAEHDELVGTGCAGRPLRHREAAVVDPCGQPLPPGAEGELVLRGPGMMTGYLDDPQATEAAWRGGWFHTGDLARLDAAGRVYLTGRIKDMIRRGGENVAAREVEDVLHRFQGVRLAAVVGVPDPLRGEEVKAVLVMDQAADPVELAAFCATQLAPYKVPRFWEFRDRLAMTASQRVEKAGLGRPERPVYDRAAATWS